MAYTICNQFGDPKPIRLLMVTTQGEIKVGEPFTPHWWRCDPCNHSSKRFEVTYRENGEPQGFPWYLVVTSDDDERAVAIKVEHYALVLEAKREMDNARREWERLNG